MPMIRHKVAITGLPPSNHLQLIVCRYQDKELLRIQCGMQMQTAIGLPVGLSNAESYSTGEGTVLNLDSLQKRELTEVFCLVKTSTFLIIDMASSFKFVIAFWGFQQFVLGKEQIVRFQLPDLKPQYSRTMYVAHGAFLYNICCNTRPYWLPCYKQMSGLVSNKSKNFKMSLHIKVRNWRQLKASTWPHSKFQTTFPDNWVVYNAVLGCLCLQASSTGSGLATVWMRLIYYSRHRWATACICICNRSTPMPLTTWGFDFSFY